MTPKALVRLGLEHSHERTAPAARMREVCSLQTVDSFDKWKGVLAEGIGMAKAAGASDQEVASVATKMGNYLSNNVDPANREQRLLKELWESGDQQDQQALAKMVSKMVQDTH